MPEILRENALQESSSRDGPPSQSLRVAFITNEFVTEKPDAGGLGNYLNRISRALVDRGCDVEIITLTKSVPRVLDFHGIRVESVKAEDSGSLGSNRFLKLCRIQAAFVSARSLIRKGLFAIRRVVGPLPGVVRLILRFLLWLRTKLSLRPIGRLAIPFPRTRRALKDARTLAQAFERRNREKPYDIVQSTNCGLSGLFVQTEGDLPHLLRMSSARDLWLQTERTLTVRNFLDFRLICFLERLCIRRATRAYAPSQFLSDYFRDKYQLPVAVVRPPAAIEARPAERTLQPLPDRFMIHFGSIRRAKGSDVLARALPIVWREAPDFAMVWAGREFREGTVRKFQDLWAGNSEKVVWVGPLKKPDLYATLERAEAAVLPSRVDNLPNTVIESLLFGIPVIGSSGASIDELVVDGVSGHLTPIDNPKQLAATILDVWRKKEFQFKKPLQLSDTFREMAADVAAENLIAFALGEKTERLTRQAA